MSVTQVSLSPTPGFCIKSTTLEPGLLPPPSSSEKKTSLLSSPVTPGHGGLLEPNAQPIPVQKGMKVFINICYDKNVPPPPECSEDAIQRAIKGDGSGEGEGEWYVPVVVSEPRVDTDKAGKASLVLDCVYNSETRKRTLRDPEFKLFLVELGLQRIEAQTGLTLSRSIGTPNIVAKGKLLPRTVRIPTALLMKRSGMDTTEMAVGGLAAKQTSSSSAASSLVAGQRNKGKEKENEVKLRHPLIEEITAPAAEPKSILKSTASQLSKYGPMIPLDVSWSWEKQVDSGRLKMTIEIPDLTAMSITSGGTYLDVEQRRIILTLPSSDEGESRSVDIDRTLSDAQLVANIHERARAKADQVLAKLKGKQSKEEIKALREQVMAESDKEVTRMLLLKREREFDVDGARAEWLVKDRKLVITL